jgi:hypothetical protein
MAALLIIVAMVVVGVLAVAYGSDSRHWDTRERPRSNV